jgi:IS605 OrfB family transposase
MQRTIRFRLLVSPQQQPILLETIQQYTDCFNAVAAYGWEKSEKNGVELHKATYYPLRAQYPDLPAQLVVSSRVKATEAVKSALIRQKQRKRVSCPRSYQSAIRYDQRSYTVQGANVSLATTQGRQVWALKLYPYAERLLAQSIGFDSADLIYRKGKFWLHLVVTLPDVAYVPTGEVVGVDFGITRPAVASNNQFFGQRRWKATERRYFRLKRALQSKGTKSAKRHLRKLARRTARFRTDCDHVVSRQLVQSVSPGTVIVIENLKEIRSTTKQHGKAQKRAMHQWTFKRLRAFLEYKAEAHGCKAVAIDPRQTSQRCSQCGHVHRGNRRSQSRFLCRNCGFELNADLNGSRNIAAKYHASGGRPAAGGLNSTRLS